MTEKQEDQIRKSLKSATAPEPRLGGNMTDKEIEEEIKKANQKDKANEESARSKRE